MHQSWRQSLVVCTMLQHIVPRHGAPARCICRWQQRSHLHVLSQSSSKQTTKQQLCEAEIQLTARSLITTRRHVCPWRRAQSLLKVCWASTLRSPHSNIGFCSFAIILCHQLFAEQRGVHRARGTRAFVDVCQFVVFLGIVLVALPTHESSMLLQPNEDDVSSFHHDSLRDTISWKRVAKDNSVRSCLIELKSFPWSKFDVNPIHRILVFFPLLLLVRCKTWLGQVKLRRIFVILVHSGKEYCLSLLDFGLPGINPEFVAQTDCTSYVINVLQEIVRYQYIVLQWRTNGIASWMSLKSSEIKNFLSSWISTIFKIFYCFLRLLPLCSSTFHQTNDQIFLKIVFGSPEFNRSIGFSM